MFVKNLNHNLIHVYMYCLCIHDKWYPLPNYDTANDHSTSTNFLWSYPCNISNLFQNSAFYWIAHSLAHHLNILVHVCYPIHIKDDGYSSNTRTPRRIILSKDQNAALTFLGFRKYAPTFHSNSSICMHLKKQTHIHAYL